MTAPQGRTLVLLPRYPEPDGTPENQKPCTVKDCEDLRLARGLCNKHYRRARRDLAKAKDQAAQNAVELTVVG